MVVLIFLDDLLMSKITFKRYAIQVVLFLGMVLAINFWQSRGVPDQVVAPQELMRLNSIEREFIPSPTKQLQLVYFFAPWCTVCKYSIANVRSVGKLFSQLDVSYIGLDFESISEVQKFSGEQNLGSNVFLGNEKDLYF